ncbi:meiotically up-regulated gene 82 protein isoform X3 [Malania oleifera]|uniref:meiotically up-regulated gene 82 protein isoform X3 n=1 Tax=Malania oleifera TaxID=397392 RepID=UPI0025AE50D1|nr:meiotically up-regulated gene 82 protein isoform X3 [Malania oleifera]XP_057977574.1 meiotically up-regulated gene 82 protein isoform X3 [Malania oleifera]
MAAVRTATNMIFKEILRPRSLSLASDRSFHIALPNLVRTPGRGISFCRFRCAASDSGEGSKKVSARHSQVQQLLQEAEQAALSAGNEPIPQITLDHVNVSFARSGGPGGQNVNKVNTKVDMRFNVKNAYWLSDRVRERIMQMEKNRINKDGELVISSTKTRTQKQSLMLLHTSHPLLQKSKRRKLPSWLPLGSGKGWRARRPFHKRRLSEEPETVGINY